MKVDILAKSATGKDDLGTDEGEDTNGLCAVAARSDTGDDYYSER